VRQKYCFFTNYATRLWTWNRISLSRNICV